MRRFSFAGLLTSRGLLVTSVLSGVLTFGSVGCEQVSTNPAPPPTASGEATGQTSPVVVNTIKPTAPAQPTPAAELEDPQAVIAKFLNTPTNERRDSDLTRLCSLTSGTEAITNLDLNASSVTDEGLKNLPKLGNIESLNLASTKITEVGFATVQELSKLRTLSLAGCNVTPGMFETLSKLESLEELSFERTQVGDAALAAIENFTHLKTLNLTGTQISDNGFKHLDKVKSLEVLKIGHTSVLGAGMQFLKRKKNEPGLRVIDASHSQFGMKGLAFLKNVETLEEIDVSQAQVSDLSLAGLKGNVHLKKINLGFNEISDQGLNVLLTAKGLQEVFLRNNVRVSDFTLGTLSKNKGMRVVDVNGTTCTPKGIAALKKLVPECEIRFMGAVH